MENTGDNENMTPKASRRENRSERAAERTAVRTGVREVRKAGREERREVREDRRDLRYETMSRKKRRTAVIKAVIISVFATALLSGITAYIIAQKKFNTRVEYMRQPVVLEESEALEAIKGNLEAGNGVMSSLRLGFKNYLIVNDGKRYIFSPINYDLKMHNRSKEKLSSAGNYWSYIDKGQSLAKRGIDVSSHQGDINWAKVKEDGIEFAICRAVYRGYGTGKLVVDEYFRKNAEGALENGIALGAYLFSQALNEQEINAEIDLLLETIEPYEIGGPVVMDIELVNKDEGRADGLSIEERTAFAKIFAERIEAAGYEPVLYFNYEGALLLVDLNELEGIEKWFASYSKDFYFPYYYKYWQYTETGKVSGIEGDVDLDLWFTD